MSLTVIYIGQDEELTQHFSRMLNEVLSEAPVLLSNHVQASRWLIVRPGIKFPIILYERNVLEEDVINIKYLRRNFPSVYILLITPDLTLDDRLRYIRAGVNDTFLPTIKPEALSQFFDFIQKIQPELHKEESRKIPVDAYKTPILKRIFDVITSSLVLIVLSPLLIGVALAIRIESKGPVFYKSKRVGSNYHIFDFWKFRSMYVDADKRLKEMEKFNQYAKETSNYNEEVIPSDGMNANAVELGDQSFLVGDDVVISEQDYIVKKRQETDNAFVKIEKDPRVTKVGQFIRKYSIDELPQLFNVLKGDMSVVGNRPLPLYEAELLTKDQSIERFIAPAGLTGLWQVEKRGDAGKLSAEERKELDIYYAKHYSPRLDIQIIFRTFTAFIQKENV